MRVKRGETRDGKRGLSLALAALVVASIAGGCGGGASYRPEPDMSIGLSVTRGGFEQGPALTETSDGGLADPGYWDEGRQVAGSEVAQLATPGTEATPAETSGEPILIYTATLYMGVYQVEESQREVIGLANELGGFLALQDDTTVVVRVPADRFEEALARIEGLGDVLHRNIQVQDVSEEFNDLNIRLEALHATRDRLQALLERAETVADAVMIERELQRLTVEIESIEGRLRFLRDRVAFSTITVTFQSNVPTVEAQTVVQLPFPWISQLGLNNLLYLW